MRVQSTENRVQGRRKGLIFVISGPSGSGKTTLIKGLLEDRNLKKKFARSVSFTTRPKRSGERQGRDYFFISKEEFLKKQRAQKLLEWTKYLGYYYGTSKEFVQGQTKKGKNILFCVDLLGVKSIKRMFPKNTVTIFVLPGSLSDLPARIKGRCQKTKGREIKGRLSMAKKEIRASSQFDYQVVNADLKKALGGLKDIVVKKLN